MLHKQAQLLASLCVAGLMGCSASGGGESANILDAAAIYEANSETFAFIRETYPGPFTGFGRVPARRPSDQTREDKIFFQEVRKAFAVEFIDFFPLGDTGRDEIDVVLKRYGLETNWTVISLVYSGIPLPQPEDGLKIAVFDKCDQRALDWFEMDHGDTTKSISAFCRINEYWYAHQIVH